jgi:hypothetical protein
MSVSRPPSKVATPPEKSGVPIVSSASSPVPFA